MRFFAALFSRYKRCFAVLSWSRISRNNFLNPSTLFCRDSACCFLVKQLRIYRDNDRYFFIIRIKLEKSIYWIFFNLRIVILLNLFHNKRSQNRLAYLASTASLKEEFWYSFYPSNCRTKKPRSSIAFSIK